MKNLFTIGAILWIGKVLASAILAKGQKLISDLRTAIESEQELKIKTILMEKDSKIEMLTGLYNHITFHEYLDNLISQCRNDEFQIQLAVIDIDDFKLINDNYGHRAGDKVILEISNIIRSIADQNDFVCRYGGEEFAVILTDKTFHQAIHTMEQIREAIQNHEFDILNYNKVTVSIGLQNYHNEYSKDYLFEGADKAMYMAKKAGKNRLVTKM